MYLWYPLLAVSGGHTMTDLDDQIQHGVIALEHKLQQMQPLQVNCIKGTSIKH